MTLPPALDRTAPSAGVHLPQAGPAASGHALIRAATLAEDLGFSDVWLSDHLLVPANADYPPSAHILEPLTAMAWVAAHTNRIRLGTTVLVLPMRSPVVVAKMLATIDVMSESRVILGAAAGWLEAEFNGLGVPFRQRGALTDEALEVLRTLWEQDPISCEFPLHGLHLDELRAKPQPKRRIPIWIGGHAPAALERAAAVGDGWHGGLLSVDEVAPRVRALRERRPEESFTISLRTSWDPIADDPAMVLRELDAYLAAGVQHFVPEPRQRRLDDYLRSIERLADLFEKAGVVPMGP